MVRRITGSDRGAVGWQCRGGASEGQNLRALNRSHVDAMRAAEAIVDMNRRIRARLIRGRGVDQRRRGIDVRGLALLIERAEAWNTQVHSRPGEEQPRRGANKFPESAGHCFAVYTRLGEPGEERSLLLPGMEVLNG